jgi:acetyl-CoA C-acetyltransferase
MARGFFDDLVIPVDGSAKDGVPRADSSPRSSHRSSPRSTASGKGTITAATPRRSPTAPRRLGGQRRGLARCREPPARDARRLGDRRRGRLPRGPADGARLRDPALLARNGLTLEAIDLWEIHEASRLRSVQRRGARGAAFVREKAGVHASLGKFPWDR